MIWVGRLTPVTVLKSCHSHETQNVAQEPLTERTDSEPDLEIKRVLSNLTVLGLNKNMNAIETDTKTEDRFT